MQINDYNHNAKVTTNSFGNSHNSQDGFKLMRAINEAEKHLVLLRIPKPTPNPRIFAKSVCHQDLDFFAAVSDGFGLSVRKTIFTYQIAVFKHTSDIA